MSRKSTSDKSRNSQTSAQWLGGSGELMEIGLNSDVDAYIRIPGARIPYISAELTKTPDRIRFTVLPTITDSNAANYKDEPIMGRSTPFKTYSHGENRSISIQLHFFAETTNRAQDNMAAWMALRSAMFPRAGRGDLPFLPPPVCQLRFGHLLEQGNRPVDAVLKTASASFPTDVPWMETTLVPLKFDVDTTWDVVYASSDLPGMDRILKWGV